MIRIGTVLYGYCAGLFSGDSYDDKTVEGLGSDWVVARETSGRVVFARVDPEELQEYTQPEPE